MSSEQSTESTQSIGPKNRTLAIFVVSVLGLFLEMLLIRWIGTEIRIFAYLQNTILIVCFLGLGLGCFTCRREINIQRTLIPLFSLIALLAIPLSKDVLSQISEMLSGMNDLLIWEYGRTDGNWLVLPRIAFGLALTLMLMFLVCETFIPLGRLLGRYMDDHPNTIWAYCVNVAGSLIGILLFAGMSAMYASPLLWFVVAAALMLFFVANSRHRTLNLALLGGIVLAAGIANYRPDALEVRWSPYQKLVLAELTPDHKIAWRGQYLITVNNAAYQGIVDLRPEKIADLRDSTQPDDYLSQYDVPLMLQPNPKRVLIVGAGSGNDVAGALRGGAEHVTAVEIDPAIIEMGRKYHPEKPYSSSRVTIVNDDARSFFETTDEKFDLIIFGLLDSHTTTAMTNARLDHYVYTRESLTQAKSLLTENGVMALTFMVQRPYIADRINNCLSEIFAEAPLVFTMPENHLGWGGTMFVTGDKTTIDCSLAANGDLAKQIELWQEKYPVALAGTTSPAVDDWPYLYLESRSIPTLYFLLAAMLLALVLHYRKRLNIWSAKSPGRTITRANLHFFFLGAGFLLLEVQNISKASVILGNTWIVNGVIISGILLMILLANVVANWVPRIPQLLAGVCLLGVCIGLYFVDLAQFGWLPYATKATVVGLLTTAPMFFAGLLFIRSFANVERKDEALGANLLGALVGGLLETLTFVIGVKALLLLVTGLYAAALYTRPTGEGTERQSDSTSGKENESQQSASEGEAEQPELATA